MNRFLKVYLVVTGILTAVLLALPWLVFVGLMMLVIPGVVLASVPTAFLWGVVFASLRRGLGGVVRPGFVTVTALGAAALVLIVVTLPMRGVALQRLDEIVAEERVPESRVTLSGDIRIDRRGNQRDQDRRSRLEGNVRPYACDALCLTLLFSPTVDSVTVDDAPWRPSIDERADLSAAARAYRLLPRARCTDRYGPEPYLGNVGALYERHDIDGRAIGAVDDSRRVESVMRLRLTNELCLASDVPPSAFDLTVREDRRFYPDDERPAHFSLSPSPARRTSFDMLDRDGSPRLRIFEAQVDTLTAPLRIDWVATGGGSPSARFRWARTTHTRTGAGGAPPDVIGGLLRYSNLPELLVDVPGTDRLAIANRSALEAVLRDAGRSSDDPAFGTVASYLALLAEREPQHADFEVVRLLILDERVSDFARIAQLADAFPGRERELREAIATRQGNWRGGEWKGLHNLNLLTREMPPGAFGELLPSEEALLADPHARVLATGLISRLSDRGPQAIRHLLELVRYHGEIATAGRREDEPHHVYADRIGPHVAAVAAAGEGLCRLGPDAAGTRSDIERLMRAGSIPAQVQERRSWHFLLARIGVPLESIALPETLSRHDLYHDRLRRRLNQADPARYCR